VTSTAQDRSTEIGPRRSRVWSGDRAPARDLSVAEITDQLARDPSTRAWWWVPRTREALGPTAELFEPDAFAVDDVLSDREPPKADTVGCTVVLIGALVSFDADTDELHRDRVAVLATDRMLAVIADDRAAAPLIRRLVDNATLLSADGPAAGLHLLLDTMIHAESKELLAMEDAADDLTTSLFDDKPMNRADQLRAFRLRQAIAGLRRVTAPMAEIMLDLAAPPPGRPPTTIRSPTCCTAR
jgi:magnesium transporter